MTLPGRPNPGKTQDLVKAHALPLPRPSADFQVTARRLDDSVKALSEARRGVSLPGLFECFTMYAQALLARGAFLVLVRYMALALTGLRSRGDVSCRLAERHAIHLILGKVQCPTWRLGFLVCQSEVAPSSAIGWPFFAARTHVGRGCVASAPCVSFCCAAPLPVASEALMLARVDWPKQGESLTIQFLRSFSLPELRY